MPKKFGENQRDLEIKAIEALKNYFKARGVIEAELPATVVVV